MKQNFEKDPYGVGDTDDMAACSATDCTGLIPAGEVTEEERERYEELYPSLTPPVLLHKEEGHRTDPIIRRV